VLQHAEEPTQALDIVDPQEPSAQTQELPVVSGPVVSGPAVSDPATGRQSGRPARGGSGRGLRRFGSGDDQATIDLSIIPGLGDDVDGEQGERR
jgi:hypothetical protein